GRIYAGHKQFGRNTPANVTAYRTANKPPAASDHSGEEPRREPAEEQYGRRKIRYRIRPWNPDETDAGHQQEGQSDVQSRSEGVDSYGAPVPVRCVIRHGHRPDDHVERQRRGET